jgi:hypothetical protein
MTNPHLCLDCGVVLYNSEKYCDGCDSPIYESPRQERLKKEQRLRIGYFQY